MKLENVYIRRYKSIEETGPFEIEPDVTCLVGKNESGKTAILQALHKSKSHEGIKFDEALDYPANFTRERREAKKNDKKLTVSSLTYYLEDNDVSKIEEVLGGDALNSRIIKVTVHYDGSNLWDININEKKYRQSLIKQT